MRYARLPVAIVLLALACPASAKVPAQKNAHGLLADPAGHTLYTYDPDDTSGKSLCTGSCATAWPPYVAGKGAYKTVDYTLTTRADGIVQWVYRGRPLYLFAGDEKPGDLDGDGVDGSWHVVH